jgi:hypothetical protein
VAHRETRAKFEEAKEISDKKGNGLFAPLVEEKKEISPVRKERGIYVYIHICMYIYIYIYDSLVHVNIYYIFIYMYMYTLHIFIFIYM